MMEQIVRMIRIGTVNTERTKYVFMTEKINGVEYTCPSNLSVEENKKIWNEIDKICRPKNFEPGLFKLFCKINFDRIGNGIFINPVVIEFISFEDLT